MMKDKTALRATRRRARPPSSGAARLGVIGGAVLLTLLVIVFLVRVTTAPALPNVDAADPTNATLVAAGERLYITRCSGCHAMPADLGAGATAQRPDQDVFEIIKHGSAPGAGPVYGMPPFGDSLSDTEIWALISYIRTEEQVTGYRLQGIDDRR